MHVPFSAPFARFLLLLAALLGSACGDATTPDAGGTYSATVTTPGEQSNGAAVVELGGARIDTVTAVGGQVFMERRAGGAVRVVIINEQPGVLQFGIRVARGSGMPRATVLEVADAADALRAPLSGYGVRFAR